MNDLKCKLKETLEFEDIWVTRKEQKCILEDVRICDTVHETEQKTQAVYKVCSLYSFILIDPPPFFNYKHVKSCHNLLTYMGVFGFWFSGVFANTVHLVQMICIPFELSDHGRCFYVPFIQTEHHLWRRMDKQDRYDR